jgi:hypothetical protein
MLFYSKIYSISVDYLMVMILRQIYKLNFLSMNKELRPRIFYCRLTSNSDDASENVISKVNDGNIIKPKVITHHEAFALVIPSANVKPTVVAIPSANVKPTVVAIPSANVKPTVVAIPTAQISYSKLIYELRALTIPELIQLITIMKNSKIKYREFPQYKVILHRTNRTEIIQFFVDYYPYHAKLYINQIDPTIDAAKPISRNDAYAIVRKFWDLWNNGVDFSKS